MKNGLLLLHEMKQPIQIFVSRMWSSRERHTGMMPHLIELDLKMEHLSYTYYIRPRNTLFKCCNDSERRNEC